MANQEVLGVAPVVKKDVQDEIMDDFVGEYSRSVKKEQLNLMT